MTAWGQAQYDATKIFLRNTGPILWRKQTTRSITTALLPGCRAFIFILFPFRSFKRPPKSSCFSSTIPSGIKFLQTGGRMTRRSVRSGWEIRSVIGKETPWSPTR